MDKKSEFWKRILVGKSDKKRDAKKPEGNNKRYKRVLNKGALTLAALSATVAVMHGASSTIKNNNSNKNIDRIHEAYEYVSTIPERAVNNDEYALYYETLENFDTTFQVAKDTKTIHEFHEFVRVLGLENKVLDAKQITNLALEVFKKAFGEKYGVDPMNVGIEYNELNIVQPREDFNGLTGKYRYTTITYKTSDEKTEKLTKDYIATGYFAYGSFEPSGQNVQFSENIPEQEYNILQKIIQSQGDPKNTEKAAKALKAAIEYAERLNEKQSEIQSDDGRLD